MPDRTEALEKAWAAAARVVDPELPMLTLIDLGVLRDVTVGDDGKVTAAITPTYSGCPAMAAMRDDLMRELQDAGFADARVRVALEPAWTTDWITEKGKAALAEAGISPSRSCPSTFRAGGHQPSAHPACRALPAMRQRRRRTQLRIRLHRLQGHVPLPRVLGTVRPREGDLT
ncbi:1,2-phenylacetyl-CoA epoxidase subunit PaaD [Arthrobacter woluwensis]|uniref:1,2-phenylacetyl-CoA epoxidase subunit PaaD n=1 Tax=Arthrobacter woluwensis TaxID=156980 RepID=UPI001FBC0A46|nr:1,2-phenylacetyl-CoA epoxidase subunit PaaD [Arthrobacter woluwensis]